MHYHPVIASKAKQSIVPQRKHGLLRRACHLFGEVRRFTAGVDLERVMEIRIRQAERNQAGFEVVDLESLVVDDHPVRAVWCFVEGLDLQWFYDRIKARGDAPGRPATDPRILLTLWLYATADGIGRRARWPGCASIIRSIVGSAAGSG